MSLVAPLAARPALQRAALKRRLERLYRTFDRSYLETDPLAFVHRYESDADREVVAFMAAGLAFGNVRAIQRSLSSVLGTLGPRPSAFVDAFDVGRDGPALGAHYHRWIRGADLIMLVRVLARMRARSGSIGGFFMEGYRSGDEDIGPSLGSFSERALALAASLAGVDDATAARQGGTRGHGGESIDVQLTGEDDSGQRDRSRQDQRGQWGLRGQSQRPGSVAKFFPSPRAGSACKRLNLFLRWMVRDGDGLDLGLWKEVSRRQLVLPLDTHLVRLTRALGLTKRRSAGWMMALEATRSLALLDPEDPVKYDFSLSRLGILDVCFHGRDALECRQCDAPRVRERKREAGPRGNAPRIAARNTRNAGTNAGTNAARNAAAASSKRIGAGPRKGARRSGRG